MRYLLLVSMMIFGSLSLVACGDDDGEPDIPMVDGGPDSGPPGDDGGADAG